MGRLSAGRLRNHLTEEYVNRTLLLIVLIVIILAALPTWPYSAGWGYYPSGGLGLLLLVLLVLIVLGRD